MQPLYDLLMYITLCVIPNQNHFNSGCPPELHHARIQGNEHNSVKLDVCSSDWDDMHKIVLTVTESFLKLNTLKR